MTKEEHEYLKQFEQNFDTAENSGYTRNISRKKRQRIKAILEKESGKKWINNIFCSSCLIELLKAIIPFYKKYKERLNNKKEKEDGTTEEI